MQAEVELPEYHRLIGCEDAAGPSDFFLGETLKWGAVTDLDIFFQRVYQYYCDRGFWCIFTQWLCELLSLGFTICFSGFLVLFVNWPGLLNAKCGIDAIDEKSSRNCDLVKEALHEHPLTPLSLLKLFFVAYLVLLSVYWLFCFLRFFIQLRDTLEVRHFINGRFVARLDGTVCVQFRNSSLAPLCNCRCVCYADICHCIYLLHEYLFVVFKFRFNLLLVVLASDILTSSVSAGSLAVSENELQTIEWPMLVDKIVQLQQHERLCVVRQLSAHDIVSRIMRKENYLIGLLNKGVLGLDLPRGCLGQDPCFTMARDGSS